MLRRQALPAVPASGMSPENPCWRCRGGRGRRGPCRSPGPWHRSRCERAAPGTASRNRSRQGSRNTGQPRCPVQALWPTKTGACRCFRRERSRMCRDAGRRNRPAPPPPARAGPGIQYYAYSPRRPVHRLELGGIARRHEALRKHLADGDSKGGDQKLGLVAHFPWSRSCRRGSSLPRRQARHRNRNDRGGRCSRRHGSGRQHRGGRPAATTGRRCACPDRNNCRRRKARGGPGHSGSASAIPLRAPWSRGWRSPTGEPAAGWQERLALFPRQLSKWSTRRLPLGG